MDTKAEPSDDEKLTVVNAMLRRSRAAERVDGEAALRKLRAGIARGRMLVDGSKIC